MSEEGEPQRPPDKLTNPTLVVAVGRLGSDVAVRIEDRARQLSDLFGPDSVRNLATLRVLDLEGLRGVNARGQKPGWGPQVDGRLTHADVVWFDPAYGDDGTGAPLPEYHDAFTDRSEGRRGHRQAFRGWESKARACYPANMVLRQTLRDLICALFQITNFVDFHPDRDGRPSRLDIYVVGDVADPLTEATHIAVYEAMSALVSGALGPLFEARFSNLAMTHLLAFPIASQDEVKLAANPSLLSPGEQARRLISRYRSRAHRASAPDGLGKGRSLHGRFLFMEDRSHRYVVSTEQLIAGLAEYVTLMAYRRCGRDRVLRDIVQPLPDIRRMRYREQSLNMLCGAFSVVTAEVPVLDIIRYCRNRQELGVYNTYNAKVQDEQLPDVIAERAAEATKEAKALKAPQESQAKHATTPVEPAALSADERAAEKVEFEHTLKAGKRYRKGGERDTQIRQSLEGARRRVKETVYALLKKDYGFFQWGLREVGLWEHHADIVKPFHDDLPSVSVKLPDSHPFVFLNAQGTHSGSPTFTEAWLDAQFLKFDRASKELVRDQFTSIFKDLERTLSNDTGRWLLDERRQIDAYLNAHPAGWKQARIYLKNVCDALTSQVDAKRKAIAEKTFDKASTEAMRAQATSSLRSLEDDVDLKPLPQRALRAAQMMGIGVGMAVGGVLSILLPWAPLGVGWAVIPAAAGMSVASWWLLRRHNQRICDDINDYVRPGDGDGDGGGRFSGLFKQQTDDLFDATDSNSFLGQRVEWSCQLWELRVWQRMLLALTTDLKRLGDIGIALDLRTRGVRDDQEGLRVRFHEDEDRYLEEKRGTLEQDTFFTQSVLEGETLEPLYARYSKPHEGYSEDHLEDEKPFDRWREQTPFSSDDSMKRFCQTPFAHLMDENFYHLDLTRERARAYLNDFLGDFSYKLALHADAAEDSAGMSGEVDQIILVHADNVDLLESLAPEGDLREHWTIETEFPDRHAVTFIRHVQGLAPWDLPSLGSPPELVASMIATGHAHEVPEYLASIQELNLRAVMGGAALAILLHPKVAVEPKTVEQTELIHPEAGRSLNLRREARSAQALDHAGWRLHLCEAVLEAISAARAEPGQLPPDGQRDVPLTSKEARRKASTNGAGVPEMASAQSWMQDLAGSEGLLELAVLLFGTRVDPIHDELENLIARVDTLAMAAQDQIDWLSEALDVLPDSWRHPVTSQLVQAKYIPYLLSQQRHDEALGLLLMLGPESLRASSVVRTLGILVEEGHITVAQRVLSIVRVPEDDEQPPMPASYDAWTGQDGYPKKSAPELCRGLITSLGPSPALATALLAVFGTKLHRGDGLWRQATLFDSHPRGVAGLLDEMTGFEPGHIDPSFKTECLRATRRVRSGASPEVQPTGEV